MRSGGPLHASTLAQLWDATMQNRNLKNAYFFAVFREKPCGGIGKISCFRIEGEVLWILCDSWGTLRVSEELIVPMLMAACDPGAGTMSIRVLWEFGIIRTRPSSFRLRPGFLIYQNIPHKREHMVYMYIYIYVHVYM